MMADRRLRQKSQTVSYEISSDEENVDSQVDSSFSSPQKLTRKRVSVVNLDSESEEIESPGTPPPRVSTAGHSLRQHADLKLSLQARENGDKRARKKRKVIKRTSKDILKDPALKTSALPKTARNELREYINTETAGKRARFFVAKREVFMPLLPGNSHIDKLVADCGTDITDKSVQYEVIEKQPSG